MTDSECAGINSYGGACQRPARFRITLGVGLHGTDMRCCGRHLVQVIDDQTVLYQSVTITRLT